MAKQVARIYVYEDVPRYFDCDFDCDESMLRGETHLERAIEIASGAIADFKRVCAEDESVCARIDWENDYEMAEILGAYYNGVFAKAN